MATPGIITKLQRLIGNDVLFLAWPLRKKGTRRRWKHLTSAVMSDPKYLKRFANKNINIGIAQGTVSGSLCSIDIDLDDEVGGFIELNPSLANSLRSKGNRGCNIWFRAVGDAPNPKKIVTTAGENWGEVRANGSQTIIHGRHPSGRRYRLIVEAPPVEIAIAEIKWPEHILNPFSKNGSKSLLDWDCTEETDETEETEETQDTQDTKASQEIIRPGYKFNGFDEVVDFALPSEKHSNHDHLFLLARAVKTLEKQQGSPCSPDERRRVFDLWYDKAQPYLRARQSKTDYMIEFLNAYKAAKFPIGAADQAGWDRATQNPLPHDFLPHFVRPDIRLAIAFCVELQKDAGNAPFFLSCRTLQRLLNHQSHTTAAAWLRALVVDEVLDEIEKGNATTAKASRYKLTVAARRKLEALGVKLANDEIDF